MTKKTAAQSKQNARRNEQNLDSRYGEIGISAVAAALQYQGGLKTSATTDNREELADAAA